MKVNEMTIGDVLASEEYKNNLKKIINECKKIRSNTREKAFKDGKHVYRHPVDIIIEEERFDVEPMIHEYITILGKTSQRPLAQRDFINDVCQEAYNKTMSKLIADEKAADNSARQD